MAREETDPGEKPRLRRLPATTDLSLEAVQARRSQLADLGHSCRQIAGEAPDPDPQELAGRIEGFVGYARVPLGVAGPVRIHGSAANGEFYVPLATTEGSLVASYQHAFNAIQRAGGARALCSEERVARAPCFEFASLPEAAEFTAWLAGQAPAMHEAVAATSRHCRLLDFSTTLVGNTAYVRFEFHTGDAAGQNMVTIATQAICTRLLECLPVKPRFWMVETNLSGDKRASPHAFLSARGRNASAEVVLPARLVPRYYGTEPERFVRTWGHATYGAVQSGCVGLQGNVANALAALFIACGQDVACVSEAVTALTRIELTSAGDVYVSVTLPNLIVGTVGGGTYLPTQAECLAMLGCVGAGKARKLAEIFAVVALAGEIAVVGAIASGAFANAHATQGRRPRA